MNLNYAHLPEWIEKNVLFRKAYLLRKMYCTRVRETHHGQFAEDVSLERFFSRDREGFFVDVGCFHPKKYSNTWRLYQRGWRGINIDVDAIKIEGFEMVRPGDVNITCAVSDVEGEVPLFSKGFYARSTSLEPEASGRSKEKRVACARLTDILDASRYAGRQIDFLSVDAEGHDLKVLQSLDFERYHPRLIAVEIHPATFIEVAETALYQFLLGRDYCLVGWCGLTLLMASRSLQRTLAGAGRRPRMDP